jgi:hypothetical protein
MRSWKRHPLQNTGIPDPSTDSDAALASLTPVASALMAEGRALVEIRGSHCLHVFKIAGRVRAINLIHFRTPAGLSRSGCTQCPRYEALTVKRFARVTAPDRTICSRSGSDAA